MRVLRSSWDLGIVALGARGVCRFDDLQRQLGISRKVLAERLKELVAEEVLDRRKYQDLPERHEYLLTAKGRDLLPIHAALMAWRERWER